MVITRGSGYLGELSHLVESLAAALTEPAGLEYTGVLHVGGVLGLLETGVADTGDASSVVVRTPTLAGDGECRRRLKAPTPT